MFPSCSRVQFLSALSWIENGGVLVEHFTGGPYPNPMGRQQNFGFSIQEGFDLSYLPEPPDEKAQLALALMREGRALNHPAYAFLSFYRALEVALGGGGKTRSKWMTAHINQIHDPHAKEVIAKLTTQGIDIGQHLYESGRCAIAHASRKPIINPDDPAEARRLKFRIAYYESVGGTNRGRAGSGNDGYRLGEAPLRTGWVQKNSWA